MPLRLAPRPGFFLLTEIKRCFSLRPRFLPSDLAAACGGFVDSPRPGSRRFGKAFESHLGEGGLENTRAERSFERGVVPRRICIRRLASSPGWGGSKGPRLSTPWVWELCLAHRRTGRDLRRGGKGRICGV